MKRFTALQLLTLIATCAGVHCQNQVALQEVAGDGLPEASASCTARSYAAIGDSYSAGLASWFQLPTCNGRNGPNCTSLTCARNYGAYGYQLASRSKMSNFKFLACSGANTSQITASQVADMDANTSLVTLTAGGDNNNMFEQVVESCVYRTGKIDCDSALYIANQTIQFIENPMASLYYSIRSKAPGADIYHLGYARFWPADYDFFDSSNKCQDYFLSVSDDVQTKMDALIVAFNQKIANFAPAHGVRFVPVDTAFQNYRFCDHFNPWLVWRVRQSKEYYGGIFHPDQNGQLAYLGALERALGCTVPCIPTLK